MSVLDDIKAAWNKEYNEESDPTERVGVLLVAGFLGLVLLGILFVAFMLAWILFKAVLPFAVGGIIIYGLGAYFLGWPVPAFVKKLVRK